VQFGLLADGVDDAVERAVHVGRPVNDLVFRAVAGAAAREGPSNVGKIAHKATVVVGEPVEGAELRLRAGKGKVAQLEELVLARHHAAGREEEAEGGQAYVAHFHLGGVEVELVFA
jgi:hypothetical protein